MRIRTQLIASAAIAAVVTVGLVTGLVRVTQRAGSDLDQQAQSQQVARHVANMLALTGEIVAYGGERAASQWRMRHVQLLASVDTALQRGPPAPDALLQLKRNIEDLTPLFDKLAQIPPDASGLARRRRDLLMERLLIETQEVGESRYAWAMTIVEQQRQDQRLYTAMVLGAPAALLVLLMAVGLLVARRVLRPLVQLRQSVTAMQAGDLDARCANPAPDELGEAARAVDSMALSLQRQTAALQASEHRLRMITDNLPAIIAHVDADERYTFANAHITWIGVSDSKAMIGRTMREERGEEVYTQLRPHIAAAMAGQRVTFESTRLIDGRASHRQTTYVPDTDGQGAVRGFYITTFDITDRKDAELRLAASQRLLVDITDSLPALVSYVDSDGRYTFANSRYRDWLGREPAQMIGRKVSEVLEPALYAVLAPRMAVALGGERLRWERQHRQDGADTCFLSEYTPDIAADGSVRGIYVLVIDISERRRAEQAVAQSEQRLHDLINAIPAMVGYFDLQERCLYANDVALALQGLEREQLPRMTLRTMLGDANYAQHEPCVREALQGRRARLDGKVPFKGREAFFQAHLIPDRLDGGRQRGFYLMTFDITALKEADQRRASVERQLRAIADNLPALIAHLDCDERYLFVNATFQRWIGVPAEEVLGRTVEEVIGAAEYRKRRDFLRRARAGERVEFATEMLVSGEVRHLQNIYVPDIRPDGTVSGIYALRTDVSALKAIEEHLNRLALVDPLTGLPNRRQFEQRQADAMARAMRQAQPVALLFLDIDHFKSINDRHGHAVGDAVLKEFAARLQRTVRSTDTAARLAGDEFVVLLEALGHAGHAEQVAEKIVTVVREPFDVDGQQLAVSTSIGVAYCSRPGSDTDLLGPADEALYEAKAAGRNTYSVRQVAASTVRYGTPAAGPPRSAGELLQPVLPVLPVLSEPPAWTAPVASLPGVPDLPVAPPPAAASFAPPAAPVLPDASTTKVSA